MENAKSARNTLIHRVQREPSISSLAATRVERERKQRGAVNSKNCGVMRVSVTARIDWPLACVADDRDIVKLYLSRKCYRGRLDLQGKHFFCLSLSTKYCN